MSEYHDPQARARRNIQVNNYFKSRNRELQAERERVRQDAKRNSEIKIQELERQAKQLESDAAQHQHQNEQPVRNSRLRGQRQIDYK